MKVAVLFVISCFIAAAYSNSISELLINIINLNISKYYINITGIRGIQEEKVVAEKLMSATSCTCLLAQCKLVKSVYECTADSECRCLNNSKKFAPESCDCNERYCTRNGIKLTCKSVNEACTCTVK